MAQPQVQEWSVVQADMAGVDVGDTLVVAALPPGRGGVGPAVREFGTLTDDVQALAAWLLGAGIKAVVMEATGVYWMPVYSLLEQAGLRVQLVNPHEVMKVPGRKSDVSDAQWLQQLASYGLLRAAYVPDALTQTLRCFLRQRQLLIEQSIQQVQRLQKVLVRMNVRLHHAVSDVTGKTGLAILRAIVAGERDPAKLAAMRDPACKKSAAEIARCLRGDFRAEEVFVLTQTLATYDHLHTQLAACDHAMAAALRDALAQRGAPPPAPPPGRKKPEQGNPLAFDGRTLLYQYVGVDLTAVPGINSVTAWTIISELGRDFAAFPTVGCFTSYLGLSPDNRVSGGKVLVHGRRQVRSRAAKAFRLAANAVQRSDHALGAYFRRMKARHGPAFAVIATANKLARIVYCMVTRRDPFSLEQVVGDCQRAATDQLKRLTRQAQKLGFTLAPVTPAALGG